jgi:predicted Ser/Thr protein kinase
VKGRQSEAVRFAVKALADDYESAESLQAYFTNSEQPPFSRTELEHAVRGLIAEGYVQAYSYSVDANEFAPATLTPATYDSLWFRLTAKGSGLLKG